MFQIQEVAVNAILNTWGKTVSARFSASNKPTEATLMSNFLTVTQSYPIGALHAEKIAKAVFLYVFKIAFSAYPLFQNNISVGSLINKDKPYIHNKLKKKNGSSNIPEKIIHYWSITKVSSSKKR